MSSEGDGSGAVGKAGMIADVDAGDNTEEVNAIVRKKMGTMVKMEIVDYVSNNNNNDGDDETCERGFSVSLYLGSKLIRKFSAKLGCTRDR